MNQSFKLAGVILICASLFGCTGMQTSPGAPEFREVQFNCERGATPVQVKFYTAEERAVLVRDGQAFDLQQARSGSGFFYTNGQTSIRGKGKELLLEIGRMAPIRCHAI